MEDPVFNAQDEIINNVCIAFRIPGEYAGSREIKTGNINRTYRAVFRDEDGTEHAYIVQSLNRRAFGDPVRVMHNIDLVTRHLRKKNPGGRVMHFHLTAEGLPYLMAGGDFWRVCDYVPSRTLNKGVSAAIMRETGRAFGEFQRLLADFKIDALYDTIPDFHNTPKRFQTLLTDAERDPVGRLKQVGRELDELRSMRGDSCILTDMFNRGELPSRVTHNDTKINNLLFDPVEDRAIAVIDLDTVMPGLAAHDFGDAIRFAANAAAEDCPNVPEVRCDLGTARAFTEGFLGQTRAVLTGTELDSLAYGPFVMAAELAARFLDDYLNGDEYFHINYPEHNLVRARCQLALARDFKRKQSELDKIIHECMA